MKGLAALALLLLSLRLSRAQSCVAEGQILICQEVPATFKPGYLSLVLLLKDAGEINSTAFHSDGLASVTRLTIDGASVTAIVNEAFASFQNLKRLSLNLNALTWIDSRWFGRPAILSELSLMENRIEVLEERMLHGLVSLTKLNLAKNRIRTINPNSFRSQSNLVELDLSGNRMTRVMPQVFGPLGSTRMRFDGNPWDCSCGVEDFADFLRDLQNRSLLEREMEVTCDSPPSLSGVPVWNVSVCVTSSPSQPTPETQTSLPPEPTSSHITAPTTTRTTGPETPLHPRPTGTSNVATVLLCLLLFVVCFLALLYKRNHDSKTVTPGPANGDRQKVRARSANAILFTSHFGVSEKDRLTLHAKTKGSSEDTNTNIVKNEDQRDSGRDQSALSVSVNAETVPYLSIGTYQRKPNSDPSEQATDNPGQRSQMGKIGRISTWPPTAVQWVRCNTVCTLETEKFRGEVKMVQNKMEPSAQQAAPEGNQMEMLPAPNQDPAPLKPTGDGVTSGSSEQRQITSKSICEESLIETVCSKPDDKTTECKSYHEVSSVSLFSEDQIQTDVGQDEHLNHNHDEIQDPAAVREFQPHAELRNPNQDLHPAAAKRTREHPKNATKIIKGHTNRQRGEHRNTGSKAPSGGTSPDDDMLVCSNEYAFIDLLHEVVQNQGRWTRERWKQIHQNKQHHKQLDC
ncbi:hypothetical protein LDENG_00255320 [Lucifuga dentata]|nr:hypothetical protein LDENG_00255320 [Lucifuga dentata]